MGKRIRLKAPEGQTTTGIYGVDANGAPYEYEPGTIIEVADDFDHLKVWPGRSELVDVKDRVVSLGLTADTAEANVKALEEQLEAAKAERKAIQDREAAEKKAAEDAAKAAK